MSAWMIRSTCQGVFVRCALVQRALVMIVHELGQLFAQALVLFALMSEQDGALENPVLPILRQFAPQIRGGGPKDQKIAGGDIVDDLIRAMLRHDGTLNAIVGRYLRRRASGAYAFNVNAMSARRADIEPSLPLKQWPRGFCSELAESAL
jgi:hypothetical protein